MRGMICRGLRLELVAGMALVLALPALVQAAENSQAIATHTTLAAETHDRGGRTQAALSVAVTSEDGQPAAGAVTIQDQGHSLAGAALDATGQAKIVVGLAAGTHKLTASYVGDSAHKSSVSSSAAVQAQTTGTPSFQVTINPGALSLTAGQSGTVVASVIPQNAAALTAPMFVTLSCSGLPDQATCTFSPENVEILPNATQPVLSTMTLQTMAVSGSGTSKLAPAGRAANPVAWAFLLPGALALGGMAWGSRKRRWLSRVSLIALVGLVAMLGTTACNPRYQYLNHGPDPNPGTPAGSYTIDVIAQSSNGVTATTAPPTPLALTVTVK